MVLSLEYRSHSEFISGLVLENMNLKELLFKFLSLDSFVACYINTLVQVIRVENHSIVCFARRGFSSISKGFLALSYLRDLEHLVWLLNYLDSPLRIF